MIHRLNTWLSNLPPMHNQIEQQQAPALQLYMLASSFAAVLWMGLPIATAGTMLGLVVSICAAASVFTSNIVGIVLLRHGQFRRAALLCATVLAVAVAAVLWQYGLRNGVEMAFVFFVSITVTGLLTGWRSMLAMVAFCVSIVVAAAIAEFAAPTLVGFAPMRGNPNILTAGTFVLVMGVIIALLTQFGAALRQTLLISLQREQELEQLRASLADQVKERTASLQAALHDGEQREVQLHETLNTLHTSQNTIRELSAPILPVLPGVLIAPLIGVLDSARASVLTENVLAAVEQTHARIVIYDITGVPLVDTYMAQVLLRTADAIRLLGAQVMLVGVRPEVAQTIVSLNIEFDTILTFSDLEQAVLKLARSEKPSSSYRT